mgnify:CR=1 FL=1
MNDDMQMGEALRLKGALEQDLLDLVQKFQSLTGLSVPAVTLEHNYTVGCHGGTVSGVKVHVEF